MELIYSGMEMWGVRFCQAIKTWKLETFKGKAFVLTKNSNKCKKNEDFPYISSPDNNKAFSTKEAAEAWILESNKIKEIVLFEDQPVKVIVTKNGFMSQCNEITHGFDSKELEEIYKSFKKLNS